MKKVKRPLTLIEVVISLSILGTLLFFLFKFYGNLTLFNLQVRAIKEKVFSRQLPYLRLKQVLEKQSIDSPSISKEISSSLFYTLLHPVSKNLALTFTYHNGADPDPAFCEKVSGLLYLNEKKQILLTTTSHDGQIRDEILFDHAASLSFEFFDSKKMSWESEWPQTNQGLPLMIKLHVQEISVAKPIQFAFILDTQEEPILYKKTS